MEKGKRSGIGCSFGKHWNSTPVSRESNQNEFFNKLKVENAIKSMEINTDAKVCFTGTLLEHWIQLFVIYSSKWREWMYAMSSKNYQSLNVDCFCWRNSFDIPFSVYKKCCCVWILIMNSKNYQSLNVDCFCWRNSFDTPFSVYKKCFCVWIKYKVSFLNQLWANNSKATMTVPLEALRAIPILVNVTISYSRRFLIPLRPISSHHLDCWLSRTGW